MLAQLLAQPNDAGGLFVLGGAMMLVMGLLSLIGLVVWLWDLIDAIGNPSLSGNEKLIWILVIIFLNVLGAILYLLIGRGRRAASA
jgi:hypothetical protein